MTSTRLVIGTSRTVGSAKKFVRITSGFGGGEFTKTPSWDDYCYEREVYETSWDDYCYEPEVCETSWDDYCYEPEVCETSWELVSYTSRS
jgi:hypothetical protein